MSARYPHLGVSTRSHDPLALLAAAREALRLARVEPGEVRRFSAECMSGGGDPLTVRRVVDRWFGHVTAPHPGMSTAGPRHGRVASH